MLKITTDGRKAALDLRLVLPHVRDNPDSKINHAVEKIHHIWLRLDADKRRATGLLRPLHAAAGRPMVLGL